MPELLVNFLCVGAGGALGAMARYLFTLIPFAPANGFPFLTLLINFIGCLVMGVLAALGAGQFNLNPQAMILLRVGLCGGFTTLSTLALETTQLMQDGSWMVAFAYVAITLVSCIAGLMLSQWITLRFIAA